VKLFDLFCDVSVRGLDVFSKAVGEVRKQLDGVQQGAAAVGRVANYGFAAATGAVLGWVRAGTQGTGVGDLLALRFQLLSRQIASVFLPAIEAVSDRVQKAVEWFRSLDGVQQDQIQRWALTGIAVLGVATVLPKVVAGVQALTVAFGALRVATGGVAGVIGAVVAGAVALGVGAIVAEDGVGGLVEVLAPFLQLAKDIGSILATLLVPAAQAMGAVIRAVSGFVAENIGFFRALILTLGAAFVAVKAYAAALYLVVAAQRAVAVASAVVTALQGPRGWAQLAAGLAIAGASAVALKKLFDTLGAGKGADWPDLAKGGQGAGRRDVGSATPIVFEGLANLNRRLQIAAFKQGDAGKDVQEKQLDVQERQLGVQQDQLDAIKRLKPAVGA
jgi:hypothetical protein